FSCSINSISSPSSTTTTTSNRILKTSTKRFYYNNLDVESIVYLKNNFNCKCLLAKTIKLTNIKQREVKIDLIIPIIDYYLIIKYVDFF
ncbi:unnamed protein product, partial [Rotaria sordida]